MSQESKENESDRPLNEDYFAVPVEETSGAKAFFRKEFGFPWTRVEKAEAFAYFLTAAVVTPLIASTTSEKNVYEDTQRYPLAVLVCVAYPLAALYGVVFMKMRLTLVRSFILFLCGWLAPLVTLGVMILEEDYDLVSMGVLGCISGLISVFAGLRGIRQSIQNYSEKLISGIISTGLYVLLLGIIVPAVVYTLLMEEELSDDWIKGLISILAAPYLLFLLLIWVFIHNTYFRKFPPQWKIREAEIMSSVPNLSMQVVLRKNPQIMGNQSSNCWNKFQEYSHLFSSIALVTCLVCCEIGLIVVLEEYMNGDYGVEVLWVVVLYIPAAPMFLFGGVIFSASKLKKNDKFGCGTVLGGVVPMVFLMPIAYLLYSNESTELLGFILGIGYPGSFVYWLSMAMLFHHNKRGYQLVSGLLCMLFVTPFAFMLPFYQIGTMKDQTFWAIFGLLVFVGLFILVVFWLVDYLKKFSGEMKLLKMYFKALNTFDISQFLYTCVFFGCFGVVGWMIRARQEANQNWSAGVMLGCFAILGLSIIVTILVHRLKLYVQEVGGEEVTLAQIITNETPEPNALQLKMIKKKKRYQKAVLAFGIVLGVIFVVPVLAGFESSDTVLGGVVTIAVGFALVAVVGVVLLELKGMLRQFGQSAISFTVVCCWFVVLMPLACFIPILLTYSEDESDYNFVSSLAIGLLCLTCMGGVSAVSITFNYLFKRMRYEKIAKYCVLRVQKLLIAEGVKSSQGILRAIFDQFYKIGEEVALVLKDGTSIFYWKLGNEEPDLRFSKEILTVKEIQKRKLKVSDLEVTEEEQETKTKEVSCWKMILKVCSNKEKENKLQVSESLEPEELEGIEAQSKTENQLVTEEDTNKWVNAFKKNIEQEEHRKELELNNAVYKMMNADPEEPSIENEKIEVKKLKEDEKQQITQQEHFQILMNQDNTRKEWYKVVFKRFGNGLILDDNGPWMTLHDLRQFTRLSGLSQKFSNVSCDLLYVKLTRRFTTSRVKKVHQKIRFEEFFEDLLRSIARSVYPELPLAKAESKMFEEFIYPNLVANLPYLSKRLGPVNSHAIGTVGSMVVNEISPKKEILPEESKNTQKNQEIPESLDQKNSFSRSDTLFYKSKKFKTIKEESKGKSQSCLSKFLKCLASIPLGILKVFRGVFRSMLICCSPISYEENKFFERENEEPEQELVERRESPEWPEICEIITSNFKLLLEEARKVINEGQPTTMQVNLTNIIQVVSHGFEVVSFCAIGFAEEVNWSFETNGISETSNVVLAETSYWEATFWVLFSLCVVYFLMLFPAVKLIKQGRLGMNKDGTKATFPSLQFFMEKTINFLSKTLYLTIMSGLLGVFSCEYDENSDPKWFVMRKQDMECFGSDHALYASLAILAIVMYYPGATLLYPNMQYQNKALDIKFDSTYLVLESQGKLIIAGFAAFFAKETYIKFQLGATFWVCLVLFVVALKNQPCLVKSYNLWKAGGFLFPIWLMVWAVVNLSTDLQTLSLGMMFSGLVLILAGLIVTQYKLYGCRKFRRIARIKSIVQGKEIYDEEPEAKKEDN